jgi:hypothetical protein
MPASRTSSSSSNPGERRRVAITRSVFVAIREPPGRRASGENRTAGSGSGAARGMKGIAASSGCSTRALPPCSLIARNPVAPSRPSTTQNNADDPLPDGFGGGDEQGVSVPSVLIVSSLRGSCR